MTQEFAQLSQHENSVISRVTSQHPDRASSKKRIMMIYSLKNNAKSGERTLKLAKKLDPNQKANQQQTLVQKTTERR